MAFDFQSLASLEPELCACLQASNIWMDSFAKQWQETASAMDMSSNFMIEHVLCIGVQG
jgi:hypothetical protein